MSDDLLKEAVDDAMGYMRVLLLEQARLAVERLKEVSEAAGEEGLRVLRKIAEIWQLVADEKIDEDTAAESMKNWVETLYLETHKIEIDAQVARYYTGVKYMRMFGNLALSFLEIAVNVAVPSLGTILMKVVEEVEKEVRQSE